MPLTGRQADDYYRWTNLTRIPFAPPRQPASWHMPY